MPSLWNALAASAVSRRRFMWLGSGLLAAGGMPALGAPQPRMESGVSSRDAREEAVARLPLNRLAPAARQRVATTAQKASIYRRLPAQVIDCDRSMYDFLLDHPDMVVDFWRVLGISDVQLTRTGPTTYQTDDGAGTAGTLEVLYRDPQTLLMIGDGSYDGALFTRRVVGRCLMLLTSGFFREQGRPYVSARLDSFIDIQNIGAELVVKTFQPLVGHFADHNFRETAKFVTSLHRAAEVNPDRLEQIVARLDRVDVQTRQEFVSLSRELSARALNAEGETNLHPPDLARRPDSAARVQMR